MIVGQLILAVAESISVGVLARVFVGAGDAMTFVCVLRLVTSWFPVRRIPLIGLAQAGSAGYFDDVTTVIQGGSSSVKALSGSTEEEQFH